MAQSSQIRIGSGDARYYESITLQSAQCTVADVSILDPALNVDYYPGRW